MAVKVADTIKPMADFPVAEVQDILAHDDDGNEINLETLLKSMKGTKVVETMEEFNEMDLEGSLKEDILYVILTPRFLYLGSKRISTFCIVVETIDEMPEGFALEQEGLVVFEKNTGLIYYEGVSYGVQLDEETLDKAHVGRTYYSIEDLKKARPDLDLELVTGQDNTMRIVDALNPRELFIDWFGNTTDRSRFGIPDWYGDRINQLMIFKQSDNRAEVTATMNKGIILTRFINGSNIEEWKDSSVGEYIYTDVITVPDGLWGFELTVSNVKEGAIFLIEVLGSTTGSENNFTSLTVPVMPQTSETNALSKHKYWARGISSLCGGMSWNQVTIRNTTDNPTPSGRTEYMVDCFRWRYNAFSDLYLKATTIKYNANLVNLELSSNVISERQGNLSKIIPVIETPTNLGSKAMSQGYDGSGKRRQLTMFATTLYWSSYPDGVIDYTYEGTFGDRSKFTVIGAKGYFGPVPIPYENPVSGDYVRFTPSDLSGTTYKLSAHITNIPEGYNAETTKYIPVSLDIELIENSWLMK